MRGGGGRGRLGEGGREANNHEITTRSSWAWLRDDITRAERWTNVVLTPWSWSKTRRDGTIRNHWNHCRDHWWSFENYIRPTVVLFWLSFGCSELLTKYMQAVNFTECFQSFSNNPVANNAFCTCTECNESLSTCWVIGDYRTRNPYAGQ